MHKRKIFIIDFDSTFVRVESLDELAEIVLRDDSHKEQILSAIRTITNKGMDGTITFSESLQQRLALFTPHKKDLQELVDRLRHSVTPSILRNRDFFTQFADDIYILSGGFADYIIPVVADFGIPQTHVLANEFTYAPSGEITGVDSKNIMSRSGGKAAAVEKLKLKKDIYVIGDGMTDYEIKEKGLCKTFIAFTENVQRKKVIELADKVCPNFDDVLYHLDLPRRFSYPKNRIKVLLLENVHPAAAEIFSGEGYTVETLSHALSPEELQNRFSEISILGIRSKTEITPEVLKSAPKLIAVGVFAIGVNQVHLQSASELGIPVFNAPHSSTRSVAELVLGYIFGLSRQLPQKNAELHKGVWSKLAGGANEIRGKNLGIIGYGNIGSTLSVLAEALGMTVCFYDVQEKLALGNAVACSSLQELLRRADVITVHVDGRKENKNLIGPREFDNMKEGAFFINASRGMVVDVDALCACLKSGKIRGAAVDVFPKEPKSNRDGFVSPLQAFDNVIMTPHIGASTEEAQKNIGDYVAAKCISFVNTGNTMLSVNFPQLQLPELRGGHRIIHIHKNMPGVLSKINTVIARHKINIEGQYLKTNEYIGYVITDVAAEYPKEVIKELRDIPETIRLRMLY
ncbi:phosphoglycerate dehydrogenase [bacterium]|nr:phosphoglycerate dehydrogenase [bacterium]